MRKSSAILGSLDYTKDNSSGTNVGHRVQYHSNTSNTSNASQARISKKDLSIPKYCNSKVEKHVEKKKKNTSKLQGSTPDIGCHSQPVGFEDPPVASPSAGKLALPRSLQGLATLPLGNSEIYLQTSSLQEFI